MPVGESCWAQHSLGLFGLTGDDQKLPRLCWTSETTFPGQFHAAPAFLCRAEGWDKGAVYQAPTLPQAPDGPCLDFPLHR